MAREIAPETRGLGVRYALALGAALVVLPTLVLGLAQPLWIGVLSAAIVFVGLALFAAVQRPRAARVQAQRLAQGQRAVLDAVMADARPALGAIQQALAATPKNAVRDRLETIATIATEVIAAIEAEPERLGAVQRLLTYYLPRTAELASAYVDLRERKTPDTERLAAIQDVLAKMESAFAHFAEKLADDDLRSLDADLKLIDAALKEDLGRP
ncbi:MAG: 5-bromo-4-chloroindolyl phosphate hydrolysis family protein [Alphaproteobacteria bacterium]|nr:5-bromo-4-chloroindolyl phosphate hydrolysis family protein [Alphaproteobacteria bacterium]